MPKYLCLTFALLLTSCLMAQGIPEHHPISFQLPALQNHTPSQKTNSEAIGFDLVYFSRWNDATLTWDTTDKAEVVWDNGEVLSTVNYKVQGGVFEKNDSNYFVITPNLFDVSTYVWDSSSWSLFWRSTENYDSQGNLTQSLTVNFQNGFPDTTYFLVCVYDYNNLGGYDTLTSTTFWGNQPQLIFQEVQFWSVANQGPDSIYTYSYTPGVPPSLSRRELDIVWEDFALDRRRSYVFKDSNPNGATRRIGNTFGPYGLELSWTEILNNTSFDTTGSERLAYDVMGCLLWQEYRDFDSNTLLRRDSYELTYDGSGQLVQQIDSTLDLISGIMVPYGRYEYVYLASSTPELVNPSFGFSLSPNPARESIRLQVDLKKGANVDFQLFDLTGREVLRQSWKQGPGNYTRDTPLQLPAGTYVYRIRAGEQAKAGRLVVQ